MAEVPGFSRERAQRYQAVKEVIWGAVEGCPIDLLVQALAEVSREAQAQFNSAKKEDQS